MRTPEGGCQIFGVIHWLPGKKIVQRPKEYFSASKPAEVELEFVQPAASQETPQQWEARVDLAVKERVRSAREQVRAEGKRFLGPEGVLAMSIETRAKSREPRQRLRPRFAARDAEQRQQCMRLHKAFQAAYRVALKAWRRGVRSVAFPEGTWWMREHHGAAVTALIV